MGTIRLIFAALAFAVVAALRPLILGDLPRPSGLAQGVPRIEKESGIRGTYEPPPRSREGPVQPYPEIDGPVTMRLDCRGHCLCRGLDTGLSLIGLK